MTPLYPDLPRTLGVYTLRRLLLQREGSELYAASQSHVEREVALELLHPAEGADALTATTAFLATARARAAAEGIPQVSRVFESLRAEGHWFLTQELPQGHSLAELAAAGKTLPITSAVRVLLTAAEAYEHFHTHGCATLLPEAGAIFIDESDRVQLLSPVIAGTPAADVAPYMAALAAAVQPLARSGVPGATRLKTLLGWLSEGYEGRPLTWAELRETATNLMAQLSAAPQPANEPSQAGRERRTRRARRRIWHQLGRVALVLLPALLIAPLGFLFRNSGPVLHATIGAEGTICPNEAGAVMRVMPAPVTVGEYADALAPLSRELRPADWEEQLKTRGLPVTGVSLVQAKAYAKAVGGNLPDARQLQAVFNATGSGHIREWTGSVLKEPGLGLMPDGAPLVLTPEAPYAPQTVPGESYTDEKLGFRLAFPLPQP